MCLRHILVLECKWALPFVLAHPAIAEPVSARLVVVGELARRGGGLLWSESSRGAAEACCGRRAREARRRLVVVGELARRGGGLLWSESPSRRGLLWSESSRGAEEASRVAFTHRGQILLLAKETRRPRSGKRRHGDKTNSIIDYRTSSVNVLVGKSGFPIYAYFGHSDINVRLARIE